MILAIISTGCASNSGGGDGIGITQVEVEPTSIIEDSTVSAQFSAVNNGNLPGKVFIGEKGTNVLTNYCPDIFSIERYDASSSRATENKPSYKLGSEEKIRINWRLKQKEERTVPRNGYKCDISFQLPFKYSVTAFKQIQVKQAREIEGSEKLVSKTSDGPLNVNMKIVGSTADRKNTVIKENNAQVYIQIQNTVETDSERTGLIKITNMSLDTTGGIEIPDNCGRGAALEIEGSDVYRCDINYDDFSQSSIRGSIEASLNYTYIQKTGSKTVKVKRSGG